nr:hypothetical protein [Acidobacteriota bacterium]
LRVWMPRADDVAAPRALALQLREQAAETGVQWIDDPTATTPSHVLRWRDGGWEFRAADDGGRRFPANATAAAILAAVKGREASLFVQLPAPAALVKELGVGPGSDYDNIQPLGQPAGAHYVLTGRLSGANVQYAWVRPGVLKEDEDQTVLPSRTDWTSSEPARDAALVMRHTALRLFKILAWQQLEQPPDVHSRYRLALRDADGAQVADGKVSGGRRYQLMLQAVDPAPRRIDPRYYYVFGIDAFGKSVLLFPRRGSVENQFPIDKDAPPPREIRVGQVAVTPPYGQDTYVVVSTDESLPNPAVLEWSGVRSRGPRGATGLEELLSRTGGSTRGVDRVETPPTWSVDRLPIRSIPPASEVPQ